MTCEGSLSNRGQRRIQLYVTRIGAIPRSCRKGDASVNQRAFKRLALRDGYRCAICHTIPVMLTVDHILSRANGGSCKDSNLRLLCRRCHDEKDNAMKKIF